MPHPEHCHASKRRRLLASCLFINMGPALMLAERVLLLANASGAMLPKTQRLQDSGALAALPLSVDLDGITCAVRGNEFSGTSLSH